MQRTLIISGLVTFGIMAGPALTTSAMAQSSAKTGAATALDAGAGGTAATRPPVPAMPPPVSSPAMTAGQTPTNPPEVLASPATPAARPPLSAPLTGARSGALGGSDQVNPSGSGSTLPSN